MERALRQTFRPEFLNRIDEIVIFNHLSQEEIVQIVDLLMKEVQERLSDRKVTIELAPEAKIWLGEKGFDPAFGARPLKRTVRRYVETPLARKVLAGELKEGDHVLVEVVEDELSFKVASVKAGAVV